MIAQLDGLVTWQGDDAVVLNVHGVGYLVFGTSSVLQAASLQAPLSLWIEMLVREDALTLYGFLTQEEQQLFRLLLGVQGVGARVALALLSTFGAETLPGLILAQDKKALTRADGVGTKLAERLVLELKDKLPKLMMRSKGLFALPPTPETHAPLAFSNALFGQGLEALTALGYKPHESTPTLESVFKTPPAPLSLEEVVRRALVLLAPHQGLK